MAEFGYARVSSETQRTDRQIITLHERGIADKNIYVDKQSGKDFQRPRYQALVRRLKEGDVVFFSSLDRMGRNYNELQTQWRIITKEKRADVVICDTPLLDTRIHKDLMGTFIADLIMSLLSMFAEQERNSIRKRQAEGVAAARLRGVRFGRPITEAPDNFPELVRKWERQELELEDVLRQSGLKEATFYRRLREYRLLLKKK